MKKVTRRLAAGVSAAALLVSAVGFDAFTDLIMRPASAGGSESNGKTGKSTGFDNLEQDTDKDGNYNTGYGLHTNKTAHEVTTTEPGVEPGRTFDVGLESWYVGENPVDVATILDASGSMAWTVDTLEPLDVNNAIKAHPELDSVESLRELQEANGGYLPQSVVDLILDKTKTDDSKLSYADYMYYIYEKRSSVAEFVPLGYWDGGNDPANAIQPIAYYSFDNTLRNDVTGGSAKYIVQSNTTIDPEKIAASIPVEYSNGGLDLYETDHNGNVVIDISSLKGQSFEISFQIKATEKDAVCHNTPLVYVGDSSKNDFYALYRGNSRLGESSKLSTGSSNQFRVVSKEKKTSAFGRITDFTKWIECKLTFEYDSGGKVYKVNCKANAAEPKLDGIVYKDYELNVEDGLYLILGGNDVLDYDKDGTDTTKNHIKNLNITSDSTDVATFPLTSDLNNTVASSDIKATLMQNSTGTGFDVTDPVDPTPLDPIYEYGGLNLNETAKNGAIMLDVVPTIAGDTDGFTISMKIRKNKVSLTNTQQNIFYLGDKDISKNDYYQFFRSAKAPGFLALTKGNQNDFSTATPTEDTNAKDNYMFYKGGVATEDKWFTSTLVFTPNGAGKFTVTPYVDGKKADDSENILTLDSLSSIDPVFLLGALQSDASDSREHFIDDLYIFNEALTEDQISRLAGSEGSKLSDPKVYQESSGECGKSHAIPAGGTEDDAFAQITPDLAGNPFKSQREGWYYVNSHSNWSDISGCLKSGKQYYGVLNDAYLNIDPNNAATLGDTNEDHKVTHVKEDISNNNKSIATVPSVYAAANESSDTSKETTHYKELYKNLQDGNDLNREFTPSAVERSLQFYVDNVGYLRCFYCTGEKSWKQSGSTWKYETRTFCSVVYQKEPYDEAERIKQEESGTASAEKNYGNPTKYEELNYALNQFYNSLAENSDLSNSAIVRFSTSNLIDGNEDKTTREKNTKEHLQSLILKDWTNWSEYYQNEKSSGDPKEENFLHNMLVPDEGESSVPSGDSKEFPYVMTGGTYTWTGLKAFYDNMVNPDTSDNREKVRNIANDARDKYLIIFTDGRDNLYGKDSSKNYVTDYSTKTSNGKTVAENYGKFYPDPSTDKYKATTDSELAQKWAQKLKDEGYTIFCVMMATGSISKDTNTDEYNKANNFLLSLAGDKDGKEYPAEKCVSVVGEDGNTLSDVFQNILKQIQQPRDDYTVQDYIDPRFDLVDASGNLYQLGAGGNITVSNGTTKKVGNVIDALNKEPTMTADECEELGLAYTPIGSYMVNRQVTTDTTTFPDGYDKGDGVGTGYLYYDDVKDMYYLRWTDQIIPMESESFDTGVEPNKDKYLEVWSATIRLKAKDDFIGGNNILTNGNEAGENLVYSDATIKNMDKGENYKLYGFVDGDLDSGTKKVPYRKKLEALSGTNRKINAVDADGVSQAVYGDGIDIPSSGFPRTTVNVRLLKLNAKNLNDVIYMGEVVSPTMMLADLENDYMTGSYYLQYLERYAYRVYGKGVKEMPLIELLNKWLKINDRTETQKTFTIPYIYLPDPEYKDGKLVIDSDKVNIQNSTGATYEEDGSVNFNDPNLRDVTGFITYTWMRSDGQNEPQQEMDDGSGNHDITIDYVVKNTKQIKYNLQLKFTPLHESNLVDPTGKPLFTLDGEKFITPTSSSDVRDKFFYVDDAHEFKENTKDEWTFTNRSDYLKAMVSEEKTYEPHVMYDKDAGTGDKLGKWVLVDNSATAEKYTTTDALKQYKGDDDQITYDEDAKTVTDKGVYDWDPGYKKAVGDEQIVAGKLKEYYTDTPDTVNFADASGTTIEGTSTATPCSLTANTTYIKDVVNAALALELFVDGKYLKEGSPLKVANKTFTFEATRDYEDPYDPPLYGGDLIGADANSQAYRLTFKIDPTSLPKDPQEKTIYQVWATLTNVKVKVESEYQDIKEIGYTDLDALPIGTYEIKTSDVLGDNNSLKNNQFLIAQKDTAGLTDDLYFEYLKTDSTASNYKYDKFPDSVYKVSKDAATDTNDGEYLILNGSTDNSQKNIAENDRKKGGTTQTVTFYFGTDKDSDDGDKGESTKDYLKKNPDDKELINFDNDYAKDRLGIIMLSADDNSLVVTKEVKNTDDPVNKNHDWTFKVTIKTDEKEWFSKHSNIEYTLYSRNAKGEWESGEIKTIAITTPTPDSNGIYTLEISIQLTHNQKAIFNNLPSGTWQVEEVEPKTDEVLYTPHNNQSGWGDSWEYHNSPATDVNTLTPLSQVDFVNEFPYALPSAGGDGINLTVYTGIVLILAGGIWLILLRRKAHSRDKPSEGGCP